MADERLTVGSLFSGIGGIDLGLERTGGFRTRWFSEIDSYANAVLRHHWPGVPNLGDVHTITDAPGVDVLAGGFPCQPVSVAGKGLAQEDPRWLWPEFARLVGLLRPRIVLVENVPGLASKGLRSVVEDLAALRYDTEWQVVSAASVGAPHLRERIFLVAYPDSGGRNGRPRIEWAARRAEPADGSAGCGVVGHTDCSSEDAHTAQSASRGTTGEPGRWPSEPDVGRVAHGVPHRLDRLRALGNGVVPQVAEFVGHLILDAARAGRL